MIIITNNDNNGIIIINKKTDKKCKQNEDKQVHKATVAKSIDNTGIV